MEIYERIKALRESLRYSQYDMAEKLSISQSAYLQIEKGKTELTITRLQQIALILGVTQVHLLGIESLENNEEYESSTPLLEKRVQELEERIATCKASKKKYSDFLGVLFHRIDWVMLVVAYDQSILTETELGDFLVKEEHDGHKTANIRIERMDNFPDFESYTSRLMTKKQIYRVLPFMNSQYSHDYQILMKLHQSDLLPKDGLNNALDKRIKDKYWAI